MIAFVFPGQGSQQVGMGQSLVATFPESREVFDRADAALGFPLSTLCFEGPEEELQLTANTQPAILAKSIAALRPLVARGVRPDWVAGHSLGEYSALVAAGALSLEDALRTVRRRGQYMQEAVPVGVGAMAAILGLDLPAIEAACRAAADGEVVAPANVNSPGQVVIAGHAAAVARASEKCKAAGAKRAIPLPVSAPFHCALMQPARDRLAPELAALAFRDPSPPLVNNVDAAVVRGAAACRDGLVRQVSGTVRWQESVERLAAEGVTTFVEVGPGTVLSGLVKKIAKGALVLNVDSPDTLEATVKALAERVEGVMGLLEGRVSLVTGASRGIGRAIAEAFAAEGATVVLAARDTAKLAEGVGAIQAKGGKAEALSLDVAERASVEAGVAQVLAAHGRIDHLVANAGVTRDNLLLRMKDEEWRQVIDTNLTGVFLCTQAVLRPMLKQKSGRIVTISSVVGLGGNAGQANYAASKAGLVGFTKSVAREVASRGITANAIAPGFIETDMTAAMSEKAREAVFAAIPLGRVGRPEDVAGAALFLVSDAAAYVTGQVLAVDGGFHM